MRVRPSVGVASFDTLSLWSRADPDLLVTDRIQANLRMISLVRGTNDKPAASQSLVEAFNEIENIEGHLFIGYPVIGSVGGRYPIDAVYISESKGVVVFDLVEGLNLGDYQERQDDSATRLQQRLLGYKELVSRRKLVVPISTITYAPAVAAR
ncbi:hypothetical protein MXD63_34355, partial [Frankia sp. Cpl3]|nr:hypothetical protein [Frankia sp. Cpl3]